MQYFTKEYLNFFKELEKNNHKEWFDTNRKRYEEFVKVPFKKFVERIIFLTQTDDKTINVEAKNCLFRINRDIRFSKDKTPYKTHMSAAISRNGRKEMGIPGLYFHLSHKSIGIYGGVYNPTKEQLEDIRYQIANDLEGFNEVISDKKFSKYWGELKGEKNKIIHKDLKDLAATQPLLLNKQFYYGVELDSNEITSENLDQLIFDYYLASKPVRVFLTKAIGAWTE